MIPHVGLLSATAGTIGTLAGAAYAEIAASGLDVTAITVAVIAAMPPTILAYAALRAANSARDHAAESAATSARTAVAVDGVVTKLSAAKDEVKDAAVKAATAEGQLAGEQTQRDRQAAPIKPK